MPTPTPHTTSRPTPPSVISKGIKYIKINRFDKQGNDNTLSLQELTNLRVKFSDLDIVDFPILTISEYPDYYLYGTADIILGNSTEEFNAPINPSPALTLSAGASSGIVSGYTDVTGSIDGSGLYTFINGGYGVTIDYSFTFDSTFSLFPPNNIQVIFTGSSGTVYSKVFTYGNPFNTPYIITSSFTYVPTSGSTLGMVFKAGGSNPDPTVIYLSSSFGNSGFNIVQDITSSIDNNILDHAINTSKTGTTVVAGDDSVIITSYNTLTTDTLGYFNTSSGLIIFGDTPNVKMYITASVTVPDQYLDFSLFGSSEGRIVMTNTSNPSGGTLILSASFTPIENSTYWLFIENNSSGPSSYSNVNLLLTQSVDPHSSTNLTVLEPYLLSTFTDSDCDVLMNNANGLEYDVNFMSVNYDGNGGTVIPSNQQEILNNTAERAPVKPYNYRLLSQIRPRYLGTKNSTDDFNLRTTTQVAYEENATNEELGATTLKQPSVSSLETYFAYFDFIGGTSYELINKKGAHIVCLIDKDGNTLTPNLTDPYYANLIQNFSSDQKINITFATSVGNVINTQGLRPIIKTGVVPKPVIWSQSGSTANSSSQIKFGNDTTLPDFTTVISLGTGSITNSYLNMMNTSGSYEITNASNTSSSFSSGSGLTNNNSYISSSADSNRVIIKPRVEVTLQGNGSPISLLFRIVTDSIGSNYDIRTYFSSPTTPTLITWNVNIPPEYANPLSSYRYEFYIEAYSNASVNLKPGGVISLLQDPSIIIIGSPYWTTGSSSNILVATSSMFSAFNQTQIFPTSSGYYSNLPFTIQKLDEIRFEGDENQTYVILDPNYSTGGMAARSNLTLLLDRDITPGTDLSSFFLRRYIPDPNFILIDVPGGEASGNGFLFPEYVSLDIQNNFDSIIQNLKAKGVIPST